MALLPTVCYEATTMTLTLKRLRPPHDAVDLGDLREQGRQILQAQHVRAIGGSMVGVGVDLHEQGIAAGSDGGARQVGDEFALARRGRARTAGELHAMSGIEDDWHVEGAHDDQGTHVGHQVIVSEGGATLGQQHLIIAHRADFLDDVLVSHGARNCPFLTLTGLPVRAAATTRSV